METPPARPAVSWTALAWKYAPAAVLAVLSLVCLEIWSSFKGFHTFQTWEEDTLFYVVGKNFVDFGFWKTKLLDDYAVGANPSAHPMLYTHFPTISGVMQGLMQKAGVTDIHAIRLLFIPLFIGGMAYFYGCMSRLFTREIALAALIVSGTNQLAVLAWADNTVHSMHWLVLFGGLFHYLSLPAERTPDRGKAWLHLLAAWCLFFVSGAVTFIHSLFLAVAIASFHLFKVHRVDRRRLAILFLAPLALLVLHHLRIISLLGWDVWKLDQIGNIRKASNLVDYRKLTDFYARHGIALWPSDFGALSKAQIARMFLDGFMAREGVTGLIAFAALLACAVAHAAGKVRAPFGVDKFGVKVLSLLAASVAWNFLFPIHAVNYFGATPYVLLGGMANLAWAAFFVWICGDAFYAMIRRNGKAYAVVVTAAFSVFSYQRFLSYINNPLAAIPGEEVLGRYKGATFYTNVWPLFVSYYTGAWAVGGLSPSDALARKPLDAKWFLQKDKLDSDVYLKPDYYFFVTSWKAGPSFAEDDWGRLDTKLELVEKGDEWRIYKMGRGIK